MTWLFNGFACFFVGLQGEGAATGLVSCGYLGGLGFLDRAHDICYRREEPFICVASIQIEQYRNLKSKDSDLLYNLPPCSLSVASNPFFFGTSRASAKADFKAQWSLGPLELLCQSMRGSMCPRRWGNCVGFGRGQNRWSQSCWHMLAFFYWRYEL